MSGDEKERFLPYYRELTIKLPEKPEEGKFRVVGLEGNAPHWFLIHPQMSAQTLHEGQGFSFVDTEIYRMPLMFTPQGNPLSYQEPKIRHIGLIGDLATRQRTVDMFFPEMAPVRIKGEE